MGTIAITEKTAVNSIETIGVLMIPS